jgi:hypothetical protein
VLTISRRARPRAEKATTAPDKSGGKRAGSRRVTDLFLVDRDFSRRGVMPERPEEFFAFQLAMLNFVCLLDVFLAEVAVIPRQM